MRDSKTNRKILIVSLFVLVFLLFPYSQASAQSGPFPQPTESWTYSITGSADYTVPVDETIEFSATATYSVIQVLPGEFTVQQSVSGTPTWPTTAGTGEIVYMNGGMTVATSNSSFSFSTTADVSLTDSAVSSVTGDGYEYVLLAWTDGVETIRAYIGMNWWGVGAFLYVMPGPFFLASGSHTMVYWNTYYAPWGGLDYFMPSDNSPFGVDPTAWTEDPVVTALGVRNALRNSTLYVLSVDSWSGITMVDTWIDIEAGILLKMTDTTTIDNDLLWYDGTHSITVELVSCNFMGLLGMLMFTLIGPIPLLYLIIAVIVILVVILIGALLCRRRRK